MCRLLVRASHFCGRLFRSHFTSPFVNIDTHENNNQQLAYFLLRVFWWGDSFGTAQWIGLAFLTLVNALTLKTIFSFLELGHPETSFRYQ